MTDQTDREVPTAEAVVLTSPDLMLPEGQRFFTSPDMFPSDSKGLPRPRFSVQEAAKFFFASGADWLRWRMHGTSKKVRQPDNSYIVEEGKYPDGWFILDGEIIEPSRTDAGARYFTLYDIERMAHALAQQGVIDGARLTNIITLVKTTAKMYGILS